MKKLILMMCVAAAGTMLQGCSDDNGGKINGIIDVPTTDNITLSRAEQDANDGLNDFAFDLLNAAALNLPASDDGNLAVSPLSASIDLAMIANIDGTASANICKLLGCSDIDALNSTCNKLMRFLTNGNGNCETVIANSIWADQGFMPTDETVKRLNNSFFAEVNNSDLSDNSTLDIIDKWCSAKTRGVIQSITDALPPCDIALINALYFKGIWEEPFKKSDTKYKDFHGTDRTTIVKMMHTTRSGVYYEFEHSAAISIPFNGNYEMVFMLPDEGITADELSQTFSAADWNSGKRHDTGITLDVPRFSVENSNHLDQALNALGLSSKLGVSNVNGDFTTAQKTSITIDEDGAVVASLTESTLPSDPGSYSFGTLTLDRPFLYFLRNTITGSILIAGRVNNLPDAN